MRENRGNANWLIPVTGVLLLIGSVALNLWNIYQFMQEGVIEKLDFDRSAMRLLPPEKFITAGNAFLWMGIIAGILCFGYSVLSETTLKGLKAILSLIALMVTLVVNVYLASVIYVDEGVPVMPEMEIVQSGDFEFLYARMRFPHFVQVYFLWEDKAYRVDGFDGVAYERTYEASRNWGQILEAYDVFVNDEDGDHWHLALVYTDQFLDYLKSLDE